MHDRLLVPLLQERKIHGPREALELFIEMFESNARKRIAHVKTYSKRRMTLSSKPILKH
jgi:hypothetical protein